MTLARGSAALEITKFAIYVFIPITFMYYSNLPSYTESLRQQRRQTTLEKYNVNATKRGIDLEDMHKGITGELRLEVESKDDLERILTKIKVKDEIKLVPTIAHPPPSPALK